MSRILKVVSLALVLQLGVGSLAMADTDGVSEGLRALVPDSTLIGDIEETSMPGVYEVMLDGQFLHVYRSGQLLMIGEIYDLDRRVSLKDERADQMISAVVEKIPVESMLIFEPEETKRHLTIFTDVDCGFCRRFHRQVPDLVKAGLEIRYLGFPRAGIPSSSYDTLVSVWCADDPKSAMTMAKNGQDIETRTCDSPVESHYAIGQSAGIRGTPTMVLDDGMVIPGYVETGELLARIGLE